MVALQTTKIYVNIWVMAA